ncbi:hypothetical protein C1Y63_05595, partial [Corynebacterium sp. 13CS0277]|uniref:hypothetical protein n=1 Tax=Corynebacterium sp. 13CS0277 TaxID=2071994 RepID=UPI000D44B3AA
MANDKNFARLGVAATIVLAGVAVSGCVVRPGAPGAAKPVAPVTEASQETAESAEFWERVDYTAINTGFDPYAPEFDIFNPCSDELMPVYADHGIPMDRGDFVEITEPAHWFSWSCLSSQSRHLMEDYEITAEPVSRTAMERNGDSILGEAPSPLIPGTIFAHNYVMDKDRGGQNCQASVDTVRGRVAVSRRSPVELDVDKHCALAQAKLEELFKDERFLRAIYGEDLPLKNADSASRPGMPRFFRSTRLECRVTPPTRRKGKI